VEAEIDAYRERLRTSADSVEVVDYGAGSDRPPQRAVADIYKRAATGPAWGRFLFGLARGLRPRRVLELGTNLGVGAAHLAGALALNEEEGGPAGRLVTLEGAPALASRASAGLEGLGHSVGTGRRIEVVVGPFAETLPTVLEDEYDLVFVDGHHQAEAALDYLDVLEPALADGAVVVLDDVEPGRSVRRAWTALRASGQARTGIYVVKYGIFVHRPTDARGAATAAARVSPPDPIRA
ncbi:O-methyltransferase, partial [Rubrivirga sp.]|uniref:O-methyltransferase n=1 Tax=Rubrivirga sp. TaxID=1885344 RepID=UPI003C78456D